MRRSASALSSELILTCARWLYAGMYLLVSSSSRRPTLAAMTIDITEVTIIRMINPTAMPKIFCLMDRLNIKELFQAGNGWPRY